MAISLRLWFFQKFTRPMVVYMAKLSANSVARYGLHEQVRDFYYGQGFHLLQRHHYLPIPEEADLGDGFWDRRSEMVGVEMNDHNALGLLADVFPAYAREFRDTFPLHATGDPEAF